MDSANLTAAEQPSIPPVGLPATSPKEDTMRKSRIALAGALMIGSLAGGSIQVAAQDEAVVAPVPFSAKWDGVRPLAPDGFLLDIVETSDARLDGTATASWNEVEYPDADGTGTYSLSQYTVRIENVDGAWQGSALEFEGSAPQYDGVELAVDGVLVLAGEGAYEGLHAVVVEVDGWNDIKGVILPAAPPQPAVPPEVE